MSLPDTVSVRNTVRRVHYTLALFLMKLNSFTFTLTFFHTCPNCAAGIMTSTYKSVNFFNQRRAGAEGDGGIQCSSGVPPPTVTDPTKELCY